MLLHLFTAAAAGILYVLLCKKMVFDEGMYGQFLRWNTIFCVCAALFLTACFWRSIQNKAWYELLSQIIFMFIAGYAQFMLLRGHKAQGCYLKRVTKFLNRYKYLIILCIAAFLLALDPDMVQFKWDGSSYYETNAAASMYSISSMALYGHPSHTFSALNLFFAAIFDGNIALGMVCGNLTVYLASICAVYGVMRQIVPDMKEIHSVTATALYAFSPFALGMVNYYGLDFYCMCLFAVVMYYTVKKQWLLQFVFGIFLVFTKEPAILIYGMICAGVVLGDVICQKRTKLADRIKGQFFCARNYGMLLVAAMWIMTVMMIGFWGGEGGFEIDFSYIADKLKVLNVLNFSWLFTGIVLAGGAVLTLKRISAGEGAADGNRDWLLPLLLSGIVYILFNCLFKTVNHPRYAAIVPVWLYLLAVYVLVRLLRDVWQGRLLTAILAVLSALLLISSYKTIDPVSRMTFRVFEAGSEEMLSTGGVGTELGDAIIYNKQALWMERALDNAMQDAVESNQMIIFPVINRTPYYFSAFPGIRGAGRIAAGRYDSHTEYWNAAAKRREMLPSESNLAFELYEVTDGQALRQAVSDGSGGEMAYFYLEFAGKEVADRIKDEYTVIEEKVFGYRGWNVYRIVFER